MKREKSDFVSGLRHTIVEIFEIVNSIPLEYSIILLRYYVSGKY